MYVLTKLHIPIMYDLRKNKHKNKAKENNISNSILVHSDLTVCMVA